MMDTTTRTHHPFSPSRLQLFAACPGAFRMQEGMPDTPSPEAIRGTMIHDAVATDDYSRLTDAIDEQLARGAREFAESLAVDGYERPEYEVELTMWNLSTGEAMSSGWADVLICPKNPKELPPIIIDFKFGRGSVPPASRNLQIAAYALGVAQMLSCNAVEAYIYQPLAATYEGRITRHLYTRPDIIAYNIGQVIRAAQREALTLCPGDHCAYCRAMATCPAARARMGAVVPAGDALPGIPTDADALSDLWSRCKLAERYIAAVKAKLTEAMDANGGRCGRWAWKEVPGRREITDLPAAYEAVSVYLSQADFLALCKISVPALVDAVARRDQDLAAHSGERLTLAEAKEQWERRLEPCIRRGEPTRSIVEVEVEK